MAFLTSNVLPSFLLKDIVINSATVPGVQKGTYDLYFDLKSGSLKFTEIKSPDEEDGKQYTFAMEISLRRNNPSVDQDQRNIKRTVEESLKVAAEEDDLETATEILSKYPEIYKDYNTHQKHCDIFLEIAAANNSMKVAKKLVESGSGVQSFAVRKPAGAGYEEMVQFLIDSGADLTDDEYILHEAVRNGQTQIISLLLNNKAKKRGVLEVVKDVGTLELLLSKGFKLEDSKILDSMYGNIKVLKFLLTRYRKCFSKKQIDAALRNACFFSMSSSPEVIALLIANGADERIIEEQKAVWEKYKKGVLHPDKFYSNGNGSVFCGKEKCAGNSAFHTGYDCGGAEIMIVDEKTKCESCGKSN